MILFLLKRKEWCVNYLSMFCPDLQKLLWASYELTRKSRPFIWTYVYWNAFEEFKKRLHMHTILHLLGNRGHFQLYSDTNQALGRPLYQIFSDNLTLVAYTSKQYLLCFNHRAWIVKLAANIASFKYLLAKVDWDCTVDFLVSIYIMKSEYCIETRTKTTVSDDKPPKVKVW